jgi:hypothetical protein
VEAQRLRDATAKLQGKKGESAGGGGLKFS